MVGDGRAPGLVVNPAAPYDSSGAQKPRTGIRRRQRRQRRQQRCNNAIGERLYTTSIRLVDSNLTYSFTLTVNSAPISLSMSGRVHSNLLQTSGFVGRIDCVRSLIHIARQSTIVLR